MEQLWRQVKEDLSQRLPANAYKIWIDPLELISTQGQVLTLACPNRFFMNWVKENYVAEIKKSWRQQHQSPVEVRLQLAPRAKKSPMVEPEDLQLPLALTQPTNGNRYRLNRRFTFEQFVVGSGNNFAYSAARAVASGEQRFCNTLYLLADTGLGKSHLSHAIGNYILGQRPEARVHYLTAEEFTNQMVAALKQRRMERFKERYRNGCDVLLLEEVQFLSGKEKIQAELAYTLDALCQDNKRVIFTGTYFPKDIPRLKSSLQSRLAAGVVSHIEPPDFHTRLKIVEKKAANEEVTLPSAVVEMLASNVTRDVRQLESCVIGIIAKSSLLGIPIDLDLAEDVLRTVCDKPQLITPAKIIQVVCHYFKISLESLQSNSRRKAVSYPRSLCMYFCRKYTDETLETIGKMFNRSHATVLHAVESIGRQMQQKSGVRNQVEFLSQQLEKPEFISREGAGSADLWTPGR